jgi:hypothetical protein
MKRCNDRKRIEAAYIPLRKETDLNTPDIRHDTAQLVSRSNESASELTSEKTLKGMSAEGRTGSE